MSALFTSHGSSRSKTSTQRGCRYPVLALSGALFAGCGSPGFSPIVADASGTDASPRVGLLEFLFEIGNGLVNHAPGPDHVQRTRFTPKL